MKSILIHHPFFARCFFFHLSLLVTLSLYGQSESQSQLDTLAKLTDRKEIIEYTLKIDENIPLAIRDSIVGEALNLAELMNNDSLILQAITADLLIEWIKGNYDLAKEKMDVAYELSVQINDEDSRLSTLNNMANYYQRRGMFDKADSIFTVCYDFWSKKDNAEQLSKNFNNRAIVALRTSNYQSADSLIQIAKKYAKRVGPRVLTSAMNTELVIASYSGQSTKAFQISNDILSIVEPISNKHLTFYAKCLNNHGSLATDLNFNKEAIQCFLKADSIYQILDNQQGQIEILSNIGRLYDHMGDHDLAISFTKRILNIAETNSDPLAKAMTLQRLAVFYTNKGDAEDLDSCRIWLDSSYQIFLSKDIKSEMGRHYLAYGNLYRLETKLDSALTSFNLAINIFESEKLHSLTMEPYFAKAQILKLQGRFEDALLSLNKIDPTNYETEGELVNYKYIKGKLLSKVGDYVQANALFQEAYDKNAELVEASQTAKIKEIADKYQAEKQIAISEKLKAEQAVKEFTISRQNNLITYGGLGLFLFSLLSYMLYRQSQNRRKLNIDLGIQKKQIQLLNQELNHRVKNNLAFMSSLLEMQGRRSSNEETRQALQESESRLKALSLVHVNLFKNESDTHINLKDYLEEITTHLRDIFEIENKTLVIRTYLVDKVVDAEDAMRIGLIVNELVTNSVKHAFAEVDNPTIQVETLVKNDRLLLRYKDNGPGIQEKELSSDPRKQGLGVKLIWLMKQQLADVLDVELGKALR